MRRLFRTETCNKVLDAARMLNYRPNPLARGLAGGKTGTIGVLWSFLSSPEAPDMIKEIAVRLQQRGLLAHVAAASSSVEIDKKLLVEYAQRRTDGLIIQTDDNMVLEEDYRRLLSRFHAVVLDTNHRKPLGCDQVIRDRLSAYQAVAKHFVETGRKSVGLVIPVEYSKDKVFAFTAALEKCGGSVHRRMVIDTSKGVGDDVFDPNVVYASLEEQFGGETFPFDALMCSTDESAIVAICWLRRQGLKVPEDVAVVGFNNGPVAEYFDPPLASVERCSDKATEAIVRLLCERLGNREMPFQELHIPMRFVWRESAGS